MLIAATVLTVQAALGPFGTSFFARLGDFGDPGLPAQPSPARRSPPDADAIQLVSPPAYVLFQLPRRPRWRR